MTYADFLEWCLQLLGMAAAYELGARIERRRALR